MSSSHTSIELLCASKSVGGCADLMSLHIFCMTSVAGSYMKPPIALTPWTLKIMVDVQAPTAAYKDDEPRAAEADQPDAVSSKPDAALGGSSVLRSSPVAAPSGLADVDSDGELPDDGRFADAAEEEGVALLRCCR